MERAEEQAQLVPYRLWIMLAFSRVPGNAFSFWIRRTLKWSRGAPGLPHEPKENLFEYLRPESSGAAAEMREKELHAKYHLEPLRGASTRALYRKNLYLLDILECACAGLGLPPRPDGARPVIAVDVGSQDWHYVFALERWLRYANAAGGRGVRLRGIEVDGYGIYPDFRSRRDYAQAYAAQTGNREVTYEVGDFQEMKGEAVDVLTWFYPFVTRYHLLLWGLPLRFYRPEKLIAKASSLLKPGGILLVYTHTLKEHGLFLRLGKTGPGLELIREGKAESNLVDFHQDVADRRFSVWRKKP